MNVFLIIPSLPLLVVLAAFLGSGNALYFVLVLTVTGWAWPARVLRSQTLSLREKDFVAAAKVSGESGPRIIFSRDPAEHALDRRRQLPRLDDLRHRRARRRSSSSVSATRARSAGAPTSTGPANNAGLLTGAWWTFVPAGVCIALVAFAFALVNYAHRRDHQPAPARAAGDDQAS